MFVFAHWLSYIFFYSVRNLQENMFNFMKLTLDGEMPYFIKWSASYIFPVLPLGHNGSFLLNAMFFKIVSVVSDLGIKAAN